MLPSPRRPLPPELLDLIINHLYDDPDSLAACALVCSSWLPSVRHRLFRHITVPCRKLAKLHGVIIRRPEIGSYIKQLIVYCVARWTWDPTCTCLARKGHTQLRAIWTRSPKLHTLRLQDRHVFAPPPNIQSVEIVELLNVTMASVADLYSWLSAFPHLVSCTPLVFLDKSLSRWEPWRSALSRLAESFNPMAWLGKRPPKRAATPPDLSHFPVSPTLSAARLVWFANPGCVAEAISKQLIAHGVSNNLRRLCLYLEWFSEAIPPSSMFAFVRSLGPSLTHLEIGIVLSQWDTGLTAEKGEWRDFSFSNCPNLQHIRLLDGWGDCLLGDSATQLSTWAPYILSNLRCPRVATICFTVGVYTPRPRWDPVIDRFLSVAMANTCFGSLARVVFELHHCSHPCRGGCCHRVDTPLKVCDEIAAGWRDHRRSGIVYEILLDDEPDEILVDWAYIGRDEKDDEGVPKCGRILRTSRDDQDPPPQ